MAKPVVAILGTFNTKGREFEYLIKAIQKAGAEVLTIDTGIGDPQCIKPDISSDEVAEAAGVKVAGLKEKSDRGYAIKCMVSGAEKILSKLYEDERINAVIGLGGSAGTTIGTSAMRMLPVGFPKMMISTVASGNVRPHVGEKDIIMMNSVVDIAGINRISSAILTNAANAIAGMVTGPAAEIADEKPLIVATMFGVTTPCVTKAKDYLEAAGYEVIVFSASGVGGKTMEALIESGMIRGVLDVTTTEWCDELVGGILGAGPDRLDAAALCGIPQVVSVGALDMVNFGSKETVPDKFKGRNFYEHNATVTLMRTTKEENVETGAVIAGKLSKSTAPCSLFIPLKGVSMIDAEGMPFYGPEEDRALFDALRKSCSDNVKIVEKDMHINDEDFALAMAMELERMLKEER